MSFNRVENTVIFRLSLVTTIVMTENKTGVLFNTEKGITSIQLSSCLISVSVVHALLVNRGKFPIVNNIFITHCVSLYSAKFNPACGKTET